MTRVILTRAFQDGRATLGILQVKGVQHDPIFTLENPQRATSDDSLIPSGVYVCKPFSGAHYKDVYEVCDVPGRSAILIHNGNFEKDTLGCILVGLKGGSMSDQPAILDSRQALDKLKALIGKNDFELEIR